MRISDWSSDVCSSDLELRIGRVTESILSRNRGQRLEIPLGAGMTMVRRRTLTSAARRELTRPALRTFFRIAEIWSLSADEQAMLLGLSDIGTLQRWRRGGVSRLSRDTLERISYVFGIFKSINMILRSEEHTTELQSL